MLLTKDLLRFRVRKEQVYPQWLDSSHLYEIEKILQFWKRSINKNLKDIYFDLKESFPHQHNLFSGLAKILEENSTLSSVDDEWSDRRKLLLIEASLWMKETGPYGDIPASRLALHMGKKFSEDGDELSEKLYMDLPEYRKLLKPSLYNPTEILQLYNYCLAKSLLLYTTSLSLELKGWPKEEIAVLMRKLKFHQLLFEVVENKKTQLTIEVSGPLNVLSQSTQYGIRFSHLLRYLLHAPKWTLKAKLLLKNKKNEMNLRLDQKSPIGASQFEPFQDQDMNKLWQRLEQSAEKSEWKLKTVSPVYEWKAGELLPLDFSLVSGAKQIEKTVHVELFMPWQAQQLLTRLQQLEKSPSFDISKEKEVYKFGVERALAKKKLVKEKLSNNVLFEQRGFEFSHFPTVDQVLL